MKRSDLIRSVQVRYPRMELTEATAIVDTVLSEVMQKISEGHRVEIRRFGSFSPRKLATRIGYNPKTGEMIAVPAKKSVHFKMGTDLAKKMNNED